MQSGDSGYEPKASNSNSDSGRSTPDSDNTTPSTSSHEKDYILTKAHPPTKHTYSDYDHLEEVPAKNAFTAYDYLEPPVDSPYAVLGNIEEVDLTSFAYQIASGMVGYTESPHCSGIEL